MIPLHIAYTFFALVVFTVLVVLNWFAEIVPKGVAWVNLPTCKKKCDWGCSKGITLSPLVEVVKLLYWLADIGWLF